MTLAEGFCVNFSFAISAHALRAPKIRFPSYLLLFPHNWLTSILRSQQWRFMLTFILPVVPGNFNTTQPRGFMPKLQPWFSPPVGVTNEGHRQLRSFKINTLRVPETPKEIRKITYVVLKNPGTMAY